MGGQKQQAIKDGKIFCFTVARILYSDTPESGENYSLCKLTIFSGVLTEQI